MTAIWDLVTGIFGTITSLLTLLTPVFILVSGIISLFFGRKFFWVFVAAVGFLFGLYVSDLVVPMLPSTIAPYAEFIRLAIALTFAGLALIVQRAGTIVIGAIATGLLAYWAAGTYDLIGWSQWVAAALGGLMGGVLLYFALDWALLVLTTLAGGLITIAGMEQLNGLPRASGPWLYILLVIAGIFYQRHELMQDKPARAAAPAPAAKKSSRRRKATAADAEAIPDAQLQPLEVTVGTPVPTAAPVAIAAVAAAPAVTAPVSAPVAAAVVAPAPQPVPSPYTLTETTKPSKAFMPVPLTAQAAAPAPVAAEDVTKASKRKLFNLKLAWPSRSAGQPLPESALQPLEPESEAATPVNAAQSAPAKPGAPAAGTIYMGTSTGGINYAPAPKPTYQVYG